MTTWKDEFRKALFEFIVERGNLVKAGVGRFSQNYGGWADYDNGKATRKHLKSCGLDVSKCSYTDGYWQDFQGTFAEPSWEERSGIDALLFCKCGKLKDSRWRYSGSYADLINEITR